MPNEPFIIKAKSEVVQLAGVVDGYQHHQHKLTTRIGGEPLEDGRGVTDHAVAEQRYVILSGIVSDMKGASRPKAAYQMMKELHAESVIVSLITEWEMYEEMLIIRCEPQSAGRGMRFEMELREILRVGSTTGGGAPGAAMTGNAAGRSGEVARGRVPLESTVDVL